MSATIGDFYQRVSRAIRRGIKYDDDIPGYAGDAVQELENSHDWKYMWEEDSDNLVISTTDNELDLRDIGSPSSPLEKVKSVRFLRFVDDAGTRVPVRKTVAENVMEIVSGRPGAFWMKDKNTLGFDAYPNKTYLYEVGLFRHSARPLGDSLEWLTMAEELLVARTIRKMQPLLRDDKLLQRWGEIENSTFPALLEAEVVSEFDGADDKLNPFTYEIEEDLAKFTVFT